nr:3-hydroxybutyryl-CoA dehydrogenase [Sphingorhabdus sp.]
MRAVGVIGAGQMGAGIAQVSAGAGYHVYLSDLDLAKAEEGKAGIAKALSRLVAKEKMAAADAETLLSRIQPVASYEPMTDAGLIIEAATEREEIKRKIFESVGVVLGQQAVLASNTSSIPITRLAQSSPDPQRFIGVHFFNPVPVMGLIEVIRGLATTDATVDVVREYGEALGKQLVFANDAPGFIVNRVLMPMINEACFALGEGVATIRDIDTACQLGLN